MRLPFPTRGKVSEMRARGSVAALLFAVWTPFTSSAEGIIVSGALDCGTWIEGRTANRAMALEHYAQGLINGLALGWGREFWQARGTSVSPKQVWLWIDKYCRDNPLDSIVSASYALFKEHTGGIGPVQEPSRRQ